MAREPDANKFTEAGSAEAPARTHLDRTEQSTVDLAGLEDVENLRIELSLEKLDDPIVNALFISIIKLMTLFCSIGARHLDMERMNRGGGHDLNKLYGRFLLECRKEPDEDDEDALPALDREAALLKALQIDNDAVRLATVQCFLAVPMEDLDAAEVQSIVR